jgi:hypothetical protein
MTAEDIRERFTAPLDVDEIQEQVINDLMSDYKNIALSLVVDCGDARELTIAMERLEESAQWAVKAVLKRNNDDLIADDIYFDFTDIS